MTSRFAGMTETLGFFVPHLTYQLALDRLQSRCRNGPWTQQTFRLTCLSEWFLGPSPPSTLLSPMTGDSNTMPPCPLKVLWMPCNVHAQTHPQGLTPGGLRNAGEVAIRIWVQIWNHYISGSQPWPDAFTYTKIVLPGKCSDPCNIMALLYRVSCKAITRQVLQSLSLRLPPSIAGGLPCRSADLLWYHTQLVIEQALATDTEMFGAVMDLQKFFNSVPRSFLRD